MPKFPSALHISLEREYYRLYEKFQLELCKKFTTSNAEASFAQWANRKKSELIKLQKQICNLSTQSKQPLRGFSASFHQQILNYCEQLVVAFAQFERLITYENHNEFQYDSQYIELIAQTIEEMEALKKCDHGASACIAQLECGRGE